MRTAADCEYTKEQKQNKKKKDGDPSKKRKKSAPQFRMKQIKEWHLSLQFPLFYIACTKKKKRGCKGSS